ncbi:MAG: hypothetical protein HYT35_00575, partial [Candidatus Staskawiczbacteria bacterium]|nr:hypothetical protein [Candidatus Staskawiczbacteria bacterium]
MLYLLNILWLLRTSKHVLFWIYLWQLKEYHIARFLDHFRTHKGKKLFLNQLLILKFILAGFFLLNFFWQGEFLFYLLAFLFFLYAAEFLFILKAIFNQSFKTPRTTVKTLILAIVSFGVTISFLLLVGWNVDDVARVSFLLLVFDILTPFIVSAIVLSIQPVAVLIRNNILKKAASKIKTHKNLKVVAITGSYGKTSTKEFLTTILSGKFKTLGTKNHQNSEIGIAKRLLNDLEPRHEFFVAEMGAYNKGGIKLLCDMVRPKIGIVTGVNEQHLALFGSLE